MDWHNIFSKNYMEKRGWILPMLFLILIGLFAFMKRQDPNHATIKGTIKPYNGAIHVWAVSNTDTSSSAVVSGQFQIKNLKPGKYRVIAEGLRPYKVTTKPDVTVNAGNIVDVGEIVLDQ
jgi:hypothetical protein